MDDPANDSFDHKDSKGATRFKHIPPRVDQESYQAELQDASPDGRGLSFQSNLAIDVVNEHRSSKCVYSTEPSQQQIVRGNFPPNLGELQIHSFYCSFFDPISQCVRA